MVSFMALANCKRKREATGMMNLKRMSKQAHDIRMMMQASLNKLPTLHRLKFVVIATIRF